MTLEKLTRDFRGEAFLVINIRDFSFESCATNFCRNFDKFKERNGGVRYATERRKASRYCFNHVDTFSV